LHVQRESRAPEAPVAPGRRHTRMLNAVATSRGSQRSFRCSGSHSIDRLCLEAHSRCHSLSTCSSARGRTCFNTLALVSSSSAAMLMGWRLGGSSQIESDLTAVAFYEVVEVMLYVVRPCSGLGVFDCVLGGRVGRPDPCLRCRRHHRPSSVLPGTATPTLATYPPSPHPPDTSNPHPRPQLIQLITRNTVTAGAPTVAKQQCTECRNGGINLIDRYRSVSISTTSKAAQGIRSAHAGGCQRITSP